MEFQHAVHPLGEYTLKRQNHETINPFIINYRLRHTGASH